MPSLCGRCRRCRRLAQLPQRQAATRRHVVMYGLGPLVVCCGVAAAGYMITQGIAHVLPHKAPAWRPAHLLCMALLAANFFFNYT
eukprot:COSAG06_NODE_48269_length_333_cov_0.880342_1_plen_84_part_10